VTLPLVVHDNDELPAVAPISSRRATPTPSAAGSIVNRAGQGRRSVNEMNAYTFCLVKSA